MKKLKSFLSVILCITTFSQVSHAECEPAPQIQDRSKFKLKLESSAFYLMKTGEFKGKDDAFKPTIIASISKILVTEWALAALPQRHLTRFQMELFVTQVKDGKYNVHIAGNHYPTFDRDKLDSIFNFLRSKGVAKIAQLSFDEKTKYIDDWEAQSSRAIQGDDMDYPSSRDMSSALSNYKRKNPKNSFDTFTIVPRILFTAMNVPLTLFQHGAKRFVTQSPPAIAILQRMNERSNNHVANEIFAYLGGSSAYSRFVATKYKCSSGRCNPSLVKMYNGSGSPLKYNGKYSMRNGQKIYNTAPGSFVVQSLVRTYAYMKAIKVKLSDVLSVNDNSGTYNHLGRYATECYLRGNVAAKTGSVFEAIALAGFLSTRDKGPIAFYMNVDTETKADWPGAKHEIRAYLTGITNLYGEGPPFD